MHVQRQIDRLLAQRAAEWIETLKSGDERDRAAFVEWLRQSKLHVEQFLEMVAIDRELQRLNPAQGEDVDKLLERIAPNVIELQPTGRRGQSMPSNRYGYFRVAAFLAATTAVCAVVWLWQPHTGRSLADFSTAVGEQKTLTLADGSVVTLNVASVIKVDFSSSVRDVDLKGGEAIFKVTHDPSRPFIVHTRTANVRAVGTQFNVDQRFDGTLVSVLEGQVRVTAIPQRTEGAARQSGSAASVSAGEQAQVTPSGRIEKRSHADVAKAVAWRQRRLVFDATPLENMVREFNSYGPPVPIRLEGIEPGTHRYGGIFDADDPNSLVDLLAKEPDLAVERRDGEIVIRKR